VVFDDRPRPKHRVGRLSPLNRRRELDAGQFAACLVVASDERAGTAVRGGSRRHSPYTSRPEIHLRQAGTQRWSLVDGDGRGIVADGSVFERVRR
jgi:hypothetical protein